MKKDKKQDFRLFALNYLVECRNALDILIKSNALISILGDTYDRNMRLTRQKKQKKYVKK